MAGYLADLSDSRVLPVSVLLAVSALGVVVLLPLTRDPVPLATWMGPGGPLRAADGAVPAPDADAPDALTPAVPDVAAWPPALRAAPPSVLWPVPADGADGAAQQRRRVGAHD
ncbi:MAG TPA: hypothetical protein DEP66_00775 [Acidimicrobiaceae bacterium]|nr:hypothetical protein [Acidimicrobiaceae bacterium]